jgi:hypothetical protein
MAFRSGVARVRKDPGCMTASHEPDGSSAANRTPGQTPRKARQNMNSLVQKTHRIA